MSLLRIIKMTPNAMYGEPLTTIESTNLKPYSESIATYVETILRAVDPNLLSLAEDLQVVTCKGNRVFVFCVGNQIHIFKVTKEKS